MGRARRARDDRPSMTVIERTSVPVASVGDVHEPASDAAATFVRLRAGVLALAAGVFVLAMGVLSALTIVGSGLPPAAAVRVIAVAGGAAACAVVLVAEAVLRRADRLGTLS